VGDQRRRVSARAIRTSSAVVVAAVYLFGEATNRSYDDAKRDEREAQGEESED